MPHRTIIVIRWSSAAVLADGSSYHNRGAHIVRTRWGKAVEIDAHEDSQAVAAALDRLRRFGIAEASAPPIVS